MQSSDFDEEFLNTHSTASSNNNIIAKYNISCWKPYH
jgi:hypothetical protein